MGSLLHPVGSQPPLVYWARRGALVLAVVLVVGGLFFQLPLPLAVIGHEGGTLLVVLNGLRLLADPIRTRSLA